MKPLYPSNNYKEYCRDQKQKGLIKKHWKDLPKMWKKELKFRKEFDDLFK